MCLEAHTLPLFLGYLALWIGSVVEKSTGMVNIYSYIDIDTDMQKYKDIGNIG